MFNPNKWDVMGGTAKNMNCVFLYDNTAGDVLTGAGYFPATLSVKTNDIIMVIANGAAPKYLKATVADGVVTATAAA